MDLDAIDAAGTWEVIVGELPPGKHLALTLAVRYLVGMTAKEMGRLPGVRPERVSQRCETALRTLRVPQCWRRIRNSIPGRPNLYRDFHEVNLIEKHSPGSSHVVRNNRSSKKGKRLPSGSDLLTSRVQDPNKKYVRSFFILGDLLSPKES